MLRLRLHYWQGTLGRVDIHSQRRWDVVGQAAQERGRASPLACPGYSNDMLDINGTVHDG